MTAALKRRQAVAFGIAVVYSIRDHGRDLTCTPTAWTGNTVYSVNRQDGASIEFGEIDFMIDASTLKFNDVLVEPRKGARIACTLNEIACVFEIREPSTGDPAWRYSGTDRTIYRVHCKRVVG